MHCTFPPPLLLSSAPQESVAPVLLSWKCFCPTNGIFQDCEKRVLQGEAGLWNSCDTAVSSLVDEAEVVETVCLVKSGLQFPTNRCVCNSSRSFWQPRPSPLMKSEGTLPLSLRFHTVILGPTDSINRAACCPHDRLKRAATTHRGSGEQTSTMETNHCSLPLGQTRRWRCMEQMALKIHRENGKGLANTN